MKKKTKIVCTLGPASGTKEIIEKIINCGMDCARLNCSHGNSKEKLEKINIIRKFSDSISIMLDTKGPEIRTGEIQAGDCLCCGTESMDKIELKEKELIIVTADNIAGNKEVISIPYPDVLKKVKVGQKILIDDGLVELKVKEIKDDEVLCEVIMGGEIGSRKTVAFPGLDLKLDPLTDEDYKHIKFGIKHDVDFIAVSFVKHKDDIIRVKKLLEKENANTSIIAKIETIEAVENIDEIIEVSDGIMVARGDLAVEISPENVPVVQKKIINKCNVLAKPVIVATQMLNTMIDHPQPTRAEVNDVANAIMDGADAVMLSGESASGKYPVKAVRQMSKIAVSVEKSLPPRKPKDVKERIDDSVASFIAKSVCHASKELDISAVIAPTSSGFTARLISRFKLRVSVISMTPSHHVYRQLSLSWGIIPLLSEASSKSKRIAVDSIKRAIQEKLIDKDDVVAITAGVPVGKAGTTNMLEIHNAGKCIKHHGN